MDALFRLNGAVQKAAEVREWLAAQPIGLADIAEYWFSRIRACGPDISVLIHDGCATACVEDAAFAYVGVFSTHVTIGFFHGADLPDPGNLLLGTGRRMRHIKLASSKSVDENALKTLIKAAYHDIKKRLDG